MNPLLLMNLANKKSDNTVLSSFAYTLDNAGNRVAMTEEDGAQTTWSYDALYQLVRKVKRNGGGRSSTTRVIPSAAENCGF